MEHMHLASTLLVISQAEDLVKRRGIQPHALMNCEQTVARSQDPKQRRLPDTVELAIGMPCMVMMNIKTEHDLANGTQGQIIDIILDPREREVPAAANIVRLSFPLRYILFKPDETKAQSLDGLPNRVFPIEPATCRYMLEVDGQAITVERRQQPVTGRYAFTDYRLQGQTLSALIIDLAKPPSGKLTLFGAYIALS